ncbi:pyridoxal phosphate-dependent aminotransferase, partial [Streptomyces globisporus]
MRGTEDTGPAGERVGGQDPVRGPEGVAPGQDPAGGQDRTRAQDDQARRAGNRAGRAQNERAHGQDRTRAQGDQARRPGHPVAQPHEDHGPVRYGPPAPDPGLPVLPELAAVLAAGSARTRPEPPGGGPALREAARGYWDRRGLHGTAGGIAAAPGAQPLLLALIGAHGGDVLMPRPCPAAWMPQARLLGRPAYHVPTPAECGGIPDPYALLETVRRVRAEGGRPKLLLLSVVDDPTATVAPPELVREACEAA